MAIRGVLLDIDGTLVDSNDAHARAWVDALTEQGVQADYREVRRRIGMGGDKLLPEVTGIDESSEQGKHLAERRKEIFKSRYLPHLRPTRGAAELLRHLRDAGLKLAVATSAKQEELGDLLRVCDGEWLVEQSTTSDDADNSKPDPDIVHAALRQAGLAAEESIFLGDTPYDLAAASKAGVAMVALRCGGWGDADLKGASAVYDDPAELLRHLEGAASPAGHADELRAAGRT